MYFASTLAQAESLLCSLEQAAGGIGFHVSSNKIEFMYFKRGGAISTLSVKSLKLIDKFTYLSGNISSTESDVNRFLLKSSNATNSLSIIWISDLSAKTKQDFFQTVAVSLLLYECTAWPLIKHIEKRLDRNFTRILHAVLKKVQAVTPHKTAVWLHTSHLTKNPSKTKTCRSLLEK